MSMSDTVLDEKTEERLQSSDGDHDRFSHYAPKDEVAKAYIMGTPVIALCGKKWIPSRDPEKYKICPECKKILESLS